MNVFDLFGEDASGVIANRKQVNDPRYSMSLSPDVRPGEVQRQLKKYNLVEGEANTARLDAVLVDLCEGIIKHQRQDAGQYGLVAAAVVDPEHNVVYGINNLQSNGKRVHAERAALDNYKSKHGDIPEGSVIVTTLSPCTEPMKEREGISCSELIDTTPIRRVYAGYRDPTQDHLVHDDFDVVVTSNAKIEELCKGFADCFLKETVNKELWHPERMFKQRVPIGDYEFDAVEKTGGMIDWDANALTIIAYDPRRKKNKQVIGKADFVVKGRGSKSRLVSDDTYVDPKYRGEGIATMMYAYARSLGNHVGHSNIRTPMGKAMWDKWGQDAQHLMAEDDATGGKLVIFDIDDTLVNTNTKVIVRRDGKPVRQLTSQEFTHYKLQPGESFDFGAFSDAEEFARESKPIVPMIQQLNNDIASGNKVVMITARSDFDNRDTFLNAFRRWDVNIDRVHVYRAGNDRRPVSVDAKKADIVRKLLSSGGYTKAIMYDDSKPNLQSFVRLHSEHPGTRFYAWHVDHSGRATEYARTGMRQPRPMFEADAADKITDAVIDFYKQQDIKPQKVDDYVDHAVSLLHKADPGIRGRVRKILSKANENPYLQGGVITTVGALLTGGLLTTASQMHLTPAQTNILLQAVLNTVIPTLVSRVNGKNWIDTIKYTLASAGIGTGIALLSEDAESDVDTIAQEFVEFANSRLKFKQLPHIDFVDHVTGTEHPTFGSFDSTTDVISIGVSDRHVMDIMRTLAHELVHHKQRETKPQSQLDGDTASEDENQANSVAGTLMREFADQHPEYFGGEQDVEESRIIDAKHVDVYYRPVPNSRGRRVVAKNIPVTALEPLLKKLSEKYSVPVASFEWTDAQGVAEGLNEITWIKPNFNYEWDEIEFQAKQPQVPADVRNYMARHFPNKQAWMKSVQHGRPVVVSPNHGQKIRNYPDNKRDLLNALSPQSHDPQGPAKAKRVNALFDKGGPIEMPIILKTNKGLWLIGGKTRLGTANLLKGIPAKVWMIGGKQGVTESKLNEAPAGGYRLVRVVDGLDNIQANGDGSLTAIARYNGHSQRNTLHFTVNSMVGDHNMGKFPGKYVIIANPAEMPRDQAAGARAEDTWYRFNNEGEINLGRAIVLAPKGSSVPNGIRAEYYTGDRSTAIDTAFKQMNVGFHGVAGTDAVIGIKNDEYHKDFSTQYGTGATQGGQHDGSLEGYLESIPARLQGYLGHLQKSIHYAPPGERETFVTSYANEIIANYRDDINKWAKANPQEFKVSATYFNYIIQVMDAYQAIFTRAEQAYNQQYQDYRAAEKQWKASNRPPAPDQPPPLDPAPPPKMAKWPPQGLNLQIPNIQLSYAKKNPQGVAEGLENNRISFQVQKGKNKFATTLSIGNNPVGVYQYDADTSRSIAEIYPEFKGKGLGKLLVLHAIYTAAKLGLDFQEDESRTSEYDNVLDSLSSSGYIVEDEGYWYVTGEGEQFLKQSLKQGMAEGLSQNQGQVRQTLNAWMNRDQQYEDPSKRAGFQAKVWPYIQQNIKTILADKGEKGNGDYPAAPYAAWLLVQHMDAYPQNQIEFYNALKQAIPNHPKIQFLRDRAAVNQWIMKNANNPEYFIKGKALPNPTVNVRNPAIFKDAGIVATSREEALANAEQAGNKLLVAAVNATNAQTQPSYKQLANENFADGKNPGRKGLAKRSGVNTKASVSTLRNVAKHSSGEKQRMAHWMANMKAGRAKAQRK